VNNKVFKDVGMPHVLMDLQGMPECAMGAGHAANGGVKRDPLTGEDILDVPCGRLEVKQAGAMTTAEFDAAIYDLVNFLSYSADPVTEKRHRIGLFTLMFIVLFFVLAWLLNREYWKDVH
jgi:ubiquinol-cytochrome c reductase cytochrome b subunit